MPEVPELGLHRNRILSVPTIRVEGGPQNCFSVNNFLTGRTPLKYGSGQHNNIFAFRDYPITDPNFDPVNGAAMWPKLFLKPGKILTVPKVVILSAYISWPEFWDFCSVDYPHDVIGLIFTTGQLNNYYYYDQWDCDGDWTGNSDPPYSSAFTHGSPCNTDPWPNDYDTPQFRYSHSINGGGCFQSSWYPQWQDAYKQFLAVKKSLESDSDNPIFCLLGHWNVIDEDFENKKGHSILTTLTWGLWNNNNQFADEGIGPAQPNVLAGIGDCDIFTTDSHRGRTHPDPNCPNWQCECTLPPTIPALLAVPPCFGANVLHIWIGHFCINSTGTPGAIWFQTYPSSPAGLYLSVLSSRAHT